MVDTISPDAEQGNEPATSQNAATGEQAANQSFVTKEEYEAQQSRLQSQSAMLGQIQSQQKKMLSVLENLGYANTSNPEPVKGSEAPAANNQDQQTLTHLIAEMNAIKESQKDGAKVATIKEAFLSQGLSPNAALHQAKGILASYGQSIEVDGDAVNGYSVGMREAPETLTPMADWMNAWLQTEAGLAVAPTKRAPTSTPGSASTPTATKKQITMAEVGNYTNEELKSGNIEIID